MLLIFTRFIKWQVAADLHDTHEVYGIVTNFTRWIFLKSVDKEILFDDNNSITFDGMGIPKRDQLMGVVGKIYSLMSWFAGVVLVHATMGGVRFLSLSLSPFLLFTIADNVNGQVCFNILLLPVSVSFYLSHFTFGVFSYCANTSV